MRDLATLGYGPTSAPAVFEDLLIVGCTNDEGHPAAPGDPRAFDVRTGKEVWRFHTVPRPGEEFFGDWGLNGWQDRRGPGTWLPMIFDTDWGIVYSALGNVTYQY